MSYDSKPENLLSRQIVDAAIEVQRELGGPGLRENIYESAFVEELRMRGVLFEQQKRYPVLYKEKELCAPLIVDLVIGGLVIVENKAVEQFNKCWLAQTLTYLRISKLKLGLVINFGQDGLRSGIHRVVNGL